MIQRKFTPFLKGLLLVILGIFLGWLLFHPISEKPQPAMAKNTSREIWTCSMHPQIHQDKPGKCPLCGMDLIPQAQRSQSDESNIINLDEESMKIAEIQTTVLKPGRAVRQIRLYGKVKADERNVQTLPAHISGRIEQLLVNYTGETILQGQAVARIYAPDLITAQQELKEAARLKDSNPQLLQAAREKLRQWKLTNDQIQAIELGQDLPSLNTVLSNVSGTITNRLVNVGDYVNKGQTLFEVINLKTVWIVFDAYESDILWIHPGSQITFHVEAIPGKDFQGTVKFVDPVLNPQTRVAAVRLEISNPGGELKPEMFTTGYLHTQLSGKLQLIVPKTAVLWTGKRSVVYRKVSGVGKPAFQKTDIELGAETGDGFLVLNGLKVGDEVVTNGTFAVDAAAQLEGKSSMMSTREIAYPTQKKEYADTLRQDSPPDRKILKSNIKVSGNCDMCKERIETAARHVKGVITAVWSSETHILQLSYQTAGVLERVYQAVADAGHDTEKIKAREEVYKALPECCLYRK